jgi:hypothetical protein
MLSKLGKERPLNSSRLKRLPKRLPTKQPKLPKQPLAFLVPRNLANLQGKQQLRLKLPLKSNSRKLVRHLLKILLELAHGKEFHDCRL